MNRIQSITFAALAPLLIATGAACAAHRSHKLHSPATAAQASSQVKVWVNTATHVYHYPNERWYGKTKHGQYMAEADAIKAGNRPAENGQ